MSRRQSLQRAIVGFHRDEVGDWVAELACGHGQHVRHEPPWQLRPWTVTEAGRSAKLGESLPCRKCERGESRDAWADLDAGEPRQ